MPFLFIIGFIVLFTFQCSNIKTLNQDDYMGDSLSMILIGKEFDTLISVPLWNGWSLRS